MVISILTDQYSDCYQNSQMLEVGYAILLTMITKIN